MNDGRRYSHARAFFGVALAVGLTGLGVVQAAPAGAAPDDRLENRIDTAEAAVDRVAPAAEAAQRRHDRALATLKATRKRLTTLSTRIERACTLAETVREQVAADVLAAHQVSGGTTAAAVRSKPAESEVLTDVTVVSEDAEGRIQQVAEAQATAKQLAERRAEVRLGLTTAAWATRGVSLPHNSQAQYSAGTPVSESELQPGDLVFYYSPISHVGLYVGDGQVVNALNPALVSRSRACTTCPTPVRSALAERRLVDAARPPCGAGGGVRPGRRRRSGSRLARLVAGLVAVVLGALLLAGCEQEVDLDPPGAQRAPSLSAEVAQRALDGLVGALEGDRRVAATDLATPASRPLLGEVYDNARALRLTDLSMRYVDDAAPATTAEKADWGQDVVPVTVQLEFAYGDVDTGPARVESRVALVPEGDDARVAGFGGAGRTPLWLAERLSVVRTPDTLTVVAGRPGRYPRLTERAVTQVRRVLPQWRGPLVVEVPRTRAELDATLDAPADRYDAIAGVTTTVDGSTTRGAPVRVYLNPEVFADLRPAGVQVVVSHEAVHVATDSSFTAVPTWLLEGFADYVALDDAGVPVDQAAAQALKRIREDGPPDRLPTTADLDPTASGLGATYELAWLACRFLGERDGTPELVRFYDAVAGGTPVGRAFGQVLGTTQAEFVRAWRADLRGLARVAG